MKVFLDTNVIFDLFLVRAPFIEDAKAIWQSGERGEHELLTSGITLVNLAYTGRKTFGEQGVQRAVRDCLASVQIAPVDDAVVHAAVVSGLADFEGAVQAASAIAAGADVIVTRAAPGFTGAMIPVLTPAAFRARYLPPTNTP